MCSLSLQQFERLFQFAKKIEDFMYTITPEEVSCKLVLLSHYVNYIMLKICVGVLKNLIQTLYISDTIPARFIENGTQEDVKIKLVRGINKSSLGVYLIVHRSSQHIFFLVV